MKFIYLFWILAILLPFFGCVSYHPGIGANIPLPFDRVYVAPVKNKSFAPQSQALLTKSVRNKLANQPGIKLAGSPDNAAILEITIIKYGQSSAGYEYVEKQENQNNNEKHEYDDWKTYDVDMSVSCSLVDGKTGKVYFKDHKVSASVECRDRENYQEAKYQAMPQLVQKLADEICEDICNVW